MYEKTCNQFLKIYTKKETVNLNLWNFIALTDLLIRLRLSNSDFYKSINQKSLNCKPGSVWGLILNHSNILHLHPTWKLYYFLAFQKWVIFHVYHCTMKHYSQKLFYKLNAIHYILWTNKNTTSEEWYGYEITIIRLIFDQ